MNIQITSTNKITKIDGVECRVWEGTTERGTMVMVLVHRIAVHNNNPEEQEVFAKELREELPPGIIVSLRAAL